MLSRVQVNVFFLPTDNQVYDLLLSADVLLKIVYIAEIHNIELPPGVQNISVRLQYFPIF